MGCVPLCCVYDVESAFGRAFGRVATRALGAGPRCTTMHKRCDLNQKRVRPWRQGLFVYMFLVQLEQAQPLPLEFPLSSQELRTRNLSTFLVRGRHEPCHKNEPGSEEACIVFGALVVRERLALLSHATLAQIPPNPTIHRLSRGNVTCAGRCAILWPGTSLGGRLASAQPSSTSCVTSASTTLCAPSSHSCRQTYLAPLPTAGPCSQRSGSACTPLRTRSSAQPRAHAAERTGHH